MKRLSPKALGKRGEDIATQYLIEQGYEIIERNWRCVAGEIDIVAQQDEFIAFVEVKARRGDKFGLAIEAVSPAKEQRLLDSGEIYMIEKDLDDVWWRIDIVAIQFSQRDEVLSIDLFVDAVRESDG